MRRQAHGRLRSAVWSLQGHVGCDGTLQLRSILLQGERRLTLPAGGAAGVCHHREEPTGTGAQETVGLDCHWPPAPVAPAGRAWPPLLSVAPRAVPSPGEDVLVPLGGRL